MNIRRLSASDAAAFQALRLAALLDTPEAFVASHAEEKDLSLAAGEARLVERPGHAVFGAFEGDTLVGIAGLARETLPLGFVVFAREADVVRLDGEQRDDLQMHLRFPTAP